jgi:very-short-patch-repair endonuclease
MLDILKQEHVGLYNIFISGAIPLQLTKECVSIGFYDSYSSFASMFLDNHDKYDLIKYCFQRISYPVREIKYHDIADLEKYEMQQDVECESPIERRFFLACRHRLDVIPQYEVDKYRLDFALPQQKVAIELDGHEYHKTKEQRTKDAQRERYLQKHGWQVIRFTGSEIYRDVNRCVQDVLDIIAV